METQIYVCEPNRPLRSSSTQVKVLFAGQDIDRSPFIVNVSKAMGGDPTRVQARGLGLQPTGNVANKPTYFDIYTAGKSHCIVSLSELHSLNKRKLMKSFSSIITLERTN